MSTPWAQTEPGTESLRELTKDWFIFLTTCRRQVRALPSDPEWMRDKLTGMLDQMAARARANPRLEASFEQARYPLVYTADEILLSCGWAGESAWSADLLETRLFGTQHAGLDFFTRLDQCLSGDDTDLQEIYFRCLCLGFKGKFIKQPEAIHNMRRDAYRRIPAERLGSARVCPEAYEATDTRSFTKLPVVATTRVIVLLLAFLVAIYVAAWFWFQDGLSELDETAREYVDPTATEGDG